MNAPSHNHPANAAQGCQAHPEHVALSPSETFVLDRVRLFDRGEGCVLTMSELGAGETDCLSERQVRRHVKKLLSLHYLRDGGRWDGNGPRILHVQPRQAAQS